MKKVMRPCDGFFLAARVIVPALAMEFAYFILHVFYFHCMLVLSDVSFLYI